MPSPLSALNGQHTQYGQPSETCGQAVRSKGDCSSHVPEEPSLSVEVEGEPEAEAEVLKQDGNIIGARSDKLQSAVPTEELGQQKSDDVELAMLEDPIVQFSSAMYFCRESEKFMTVDVMRIGNGLDKSEVHYTTEDSSAKAGVRYGHVEGTLIFESGDSEKSIQIPLYVTKCWEPTTEFKIVLKSDPPPVGCVLGKYLFQARIKVIDEKVFPMDVFREKVKEGMQVEDPFEREEYLSDGKLLRGYFRWNTMNPIVWSGMKRTVFLYQAHNLYFTLKLFMHLYVIELLQGKVKMFEDDSVSLVVVALMFVLPMFGLHFFDVREPTWKVGGASRASLQKALLMRFLNYSEDSRSDCDQGALIMGMTRDVRELVHDGFVNALSMVRLVGQLFWTLVFQLSAPIIFDAPFRPMAFVVMFVFPFLMVIFLTLRRRTTTVHVRDSKHKENAFIDQMCRCMTNYRLIADYNRRPFFMDRFAAKITSYNIAFIKETQVLKNSSYFAPWLTVMFVGLHIIIVGRMVINRPDELGMFLVNLSVIGEIGSVWSAIYIVLSDMQRILPALGNMMVFLNLETDVPQRMALNRERRAVTATKRAAIRKMHGRAVIPVDELPIIVQDCDFSYSKRWNGSVLNNNGTLSVHQGQLVSLIGPKGEGKSTLLKLIGSVILPKPSPGYFIPSHLRVLHVSTDTLFFMGSLYDNLTFGVAPGDADGDVKRVQEICVNLGLAEWLIQEIENKDHVNKFWNDHLSQTQKSLLCLARALISNPELLCVHKPTMTLDESIAKNVLHRLREFVRHKGLVQDPNKRHMRRVRTCIMTSGRLMGCEMADQVYLVSRSRGIEVITNKSQITLNMLD
eukprot:TRINITY_DN20072_c0_g1_i1.p1 TRINITY_DN20072_c0_g1~~TRINITY_DN20072_c0_g1_i1.p1  ORF type:complete len:849 (+),score=164.78 TRINITY_DN20072_c0_g1_i1:77-2623(+)